MFGKPIDYPLPLSLHMSLASIKAYSRLQGEPVFGLPLHKRLRFNGGIGFKEVCGLDIEGGEGGGHDWEVLLHRHMVVPDVVPHDHIGFVHRTVPAQRK